jgi:hypothetical protein
VKEPHQAVLIMLLSLHFKIKLENLSQKIIAITIHHTPLFMICAFRVVTASTNLAISLPDVYITRTLHKVHFLTHGATTATNPVASWHTPMHALGVEPMCFRSKLSNSLTLLLIIYIKDNR